MEPAKYETIADFIAAGKAEEALSCLAQIQGAEEFVILLKARFSNYLTDKSLGTVSPDKLNIEFLQINQSILQLAKSVLPSVPKAPGPQIPHYQLTGPDDSRLWIEAPLLGREEELDKIAALLDDLNCRALTIIGEAGLGKTEFCRQALQNLLQKNPDATVYWVDAEHLNSAEGLLNELRKLTGLSPESKQDGVLQALANLPGLYYLDNLESITDDLETRPLLHALLRTNGSRWLASSREAVGGWGRPFPLPELPEAAALELFCRHWSQSTGEMLPAETTPELKKFVFERLGCHPLSIVLTASHADFPNLKSVTEAWESQWKSIVQRHAGDGDRRLDNLETSIRLSHQKVRGMPGALRLWALSILFPDGMDAEQQDYFIRQGVFSAADRAALVQRNVLRQRKGLLWALPPLVRYAEELLRQNSDGFSEAQFFEDALPYAVEYAPEHFAVPDELRTLWFSRLPYVFRLMELYSKSPEVYPGYVIVPFSTTKNPKVLHSILLRRGLIRDPPKPSSLHGRMFNYYVRFDIFSSRKILTSLLQKEEIRKNNFAYAYALFSLGRVELYLSQNDNARYFFHKALPVFEEIGSDLGKANTLRSLGDLEFSLSQNDTAKDFFQQALTLYKKVGHDLGKANTLRNLGDLEFRLSQNDNAKDFFQQALTLYKKVGDDLGKANSLQSLGELELSLSQNDTAKAFFQQALPLFEKVGDDLGKANTLQSLGELEFSLSQNDNARAFFQQALPLFEKVGSDLGKANTLRNLGDLEVKSSQNDNARYFFQHALMLYEKVGSDLGKANTLQSFGELEFSLSQKDNARAFFQQALLLFEKVGSDLGKANTLCNFGDLEFRLSQNDNARAFFQQALPLYEKVGNDIGKGNVFQGLGLLSLRNEKQVQEALTLLKQSLAFFEKAQSPDGICEVHAYLAEAFFKGGMEVEAKEHFKEATAMAAQLKLPYLQKIVEEVSREIGVSI